MWGRDTVGGRGGLMSECGWIWRTSRRLKARKTKRAAGKEGSNAGALVCRGNRGSRTVCAAVWLCAVRCGILSGRRWWRCDGGVEAVLAT